MFYSYRQAYTSHLFRHFSYFHSKGPIPSRQRLAKDHKAACACSISPPGSSHGAVLCSTTELVFIAIPLPGSVVMQSWRLWLGLVFLTPGEQ